MIIPDQAVECGRVVGGYSESVVIVKVVLTGLGFLVGKAYCIGDSIFYAQEAVIRGAPLRPKDVAVAVIRIELPDLVNVAVVR